MSELNRKIIICFDCKIENKESHLKYIRVQKEMIIFIDCQPHYTFLQIIWQ